MLTKQEQQVKSTSNFYFKS